jgi:hypothetical protein
MPGPLLPPWIDRARPLAGVLLVLAPVYLTFVIYYGGSPRTLAVGYQPVQPVPYSHRLHAGDLGIDCRYCHNTVEVAADAAVPPTATCMNCHATIATDSAKLLLVRESAASGASIHWQRVHDLPDYVYFNHSAHVARGVGCVSCHGRVDKMERVYQAEKLSMSWCLDCHRDPQGHLRPQQYITDMTWVPEEDPAELGARLMKENDIHPSTDCATCHR